MSEFCPLLRLSLRGQSPDTAFCDDDGLPVITPGRSRSDPYIQHEGCIGGEYGAQNCTFINGVPANFISYLTESKG